MTTSDIEIGISVESISDHFLISPNDLHRGDGEYAGLTLHERGMLAALLTLRPSNGRQWNTSRASINDLAPELGRDKISSILKALATKRYLYKRRVNMGAGRFRWEWRVFMKARPDGYDPFANDVPTIDGTTVDGKSVNGCDLRKGDVSTGRTIDGLSVTDRTSLKEVPNPKKYQKKTPPPPTPQTPPAPTTETSPTTGGEETDEETTAITDAIRHQPTWRPIATRAAIRQAIAEGLPGPVAYRVIVDLARGDTYGPTTAGPQRIIARGPWWTPGAVFAPAPSKNIKNECERHTGQLDGSCACCEGERRGVIPTGPTIALATSVPAQARDLFAQVPAFQRARGRRPAAPTNR